MKKGFKTKSSLWRKLNFLKNKYFYIGLFVFILSIVLNLLASWYLLEKYPGKLFVLYDLILNNIPYYSVAFLSDLLVVFSLVLFIVYVVHKKKEDEISYYLFLLGFFYIIRAVFIVVTPLGNPVESYNRIFNGSLFDIGSYPSGHIGTCFLMLLLSKGTYKYLISFLLIGLVGTILFSRSHYSIDVFSAFIFVYAVYSFSSNYLKKYFVKKI